MPQILDSFRSSTSGWLKGTLAGWATLLLCLVGIGFLIILAKWVQNVGATFEVTGDRLIIRRGILSKSLDEIELYRVKDIKLNYSLLNQWANIGTITILSSDETTRAAPLVIPFVEDAMARREQLRTLVDQARQRRRVREVDMVQEDMG